jgi:hypothetical protein
MTTIDTDTDRGYLIDAFLGARTILSEPGAWCQQNLALHREHRGEYGVDPLNPEADTFCLVGAIKAATGQPVTKHPAVEYLRDLLRRRLDYKGTPQWWNDIEGRTQAEVVGLLDTAIEELKNEPSP